MPSQVDLTVVVLTHNEEENIEACIKSCLFAKEILVIDDDSTDETIRMAESLGARVLHRSMNGDFGAQKTFGLNNAMYPWVFIVDADERVTPELAKEIKLVVEKNDPCCYAVQRENHFYSGNATHGVLRPDWVVRLVPKKQTTVEGQVHEKVLSPYQTKKISGFLIHYPYRDWEAYFRKFDKYTSLSAEKYIASGKRCSFIKDILIRPLWAFIKVYFLNLGFLDGKLGWIFSVNHYFYTMMKYVKLYALEKSKGRL